MFKILGAKNCRKNLHKHPGPPFQIRGGHLVLLVMPKGLLLQPNFEEFLSEVLRKNRWVRLFVSFYSMYTLEPPVILL